MQYKGIDNKEAYNKGLNDAWEFVRKTNTAVHPREAFKLIDFFGVANYRDIYVEYTPQEALAKLEAYEKEQNEIKVGDVVICEDAGTKGVVVKVKDETIYILFRDGSAGKNEKDGFKKTGKHIDIQKLLDELKEGV